MGLSDRNPFIQSNNSSPGGIGNILFGSDADIESTVGDEDDDDEEDEGRTLQARRDALAALDPYSYESMRAEFKSLKVPSESVSKVPGVESSTEKQHIKNYHGSLQHELDTNATWDVEDKTHIQQSSIEFSTPRSSIANKNGFLRVNAQMAASPESEENCVPDIAISIATPSPPSSKSRHHRRGSSIARNAGLLSATYTPSPLSLGHQGSSQLEDSEDIPSDALFCDGSKRSSTVYKPYFSRITGNNGRIVSNHSNTAVDTGAVHVTDEIEDHIGVVMNENSDSSVRRNTFGAPIPPRFTLQQGQTLSEQRADDLTVNVEHSLVSTRSPTIPKKTTVQHRFRRQASKRSNLDPWDSCEEMLIQATDDEDDGGFFGPLDELNGKVGGRRRNDVPAMGNDVPSADGSRSDGIRFGRGVVDEWAVHPRRAAIRRTYNKIHDPIPTPPKSNHDDDANKSFQAAMSPRPLSSVSDYTTISLSSPPMMKRTSGATGLSRGGSLDSSYYRLKRGAASLLMGFGSTQAEQFNYFKGQEKKDQGLVEDDHQMHRMMNGGNVLKSPNSDQRESVMTFEPPLVHRNETSLARGTASSFSSFHALLAESDRSKSGITGRNSDKTNSNSSPPPFSPSAYLRRSQTTAFAGSNLGTSSGSRVSFSPISHRKTPAMVPTIVIPPPHRHNQHEHSALFSATAVECAPSPALSDTTAIGWSPMGFDDDEQYRPPKRLQDHDVYNRDTMDSPTLTIQSASSSATCQRNTLSMLSPPQRDDLLKVPEPTKPIYSTRSIDNSSDNQHMSVAALAMAAAQRGLCGRQGPSGSTSIDFTQDDYIGQFERERAHARARGDPSSSFGSLATTMYSSFVSDGGGSSSTNTLHMLPHSTYGNTGRNLMKSNHYGQNDSGSFDVYAKERATSRFGFGFFSSATTTAVPTSTDRRQRQETNQSDVSEKLMHLPEPSPFEGICTCRGIFNISSMVLILLGLVLLILGYPIVSSLKKERLEAEAAAAIAAAAAGLAAATKTTASAVAGNMGMNNNTADTRIAGVQFTNLDATPNIILSGETGAMIDPETPLEKRTRAAFDGTQWALVFSDEFNKDGRGFGPGEDPHWEAMNLAPSATGSLEEYSSDNVRTKDGHLEITLDRRPLPAGKLRKRQDQSPGSLWTFTSGMLQGWNKMCIQGGLVEVSVSLPGNPGLPGLKPRIFLLGNLARYGYQATMDGVYPYSYSKCDSSANGTNTAPSNQTRQRLNACTNIENGITIGRGAPEISLLETHYGIQSKASALDAQKQRIQLQRRSPPLLRKRQIQADGGTVILESQQRLSASRIVTETPEVARLGDSSGDQRNAQSIAIASVKVASPGTNDPGRASDDTLSMPQWIQPLDRASFEGVKGSFDSDVKYITVGVEYSYGINISQSSNPEPSIKMAPTTTTTSTTSDTTSTAAMLTPAYAQFLMGDKWQDSPLMNQEDYHRYSSNNSGISPTTSTSQAPNRWRNAKALSGGQLIPQEPMSMVLSLGLLADEILMHPDLTFPAIMKIDYVRVYHPSQGAGRGGRGSMSCDPVDHPTAEYIRTHPRAYQDPNVHTWAEAGHVFANGHESHNRFCFFAHFRLNGNMSTVRYTRLSLAVLDATADFIHESRAAALRWIDKVRTAVVENLPTDDNYPAGPDNTVPAPSRTFEETSDDLLDDLLDDAANSASYSECLQQVGPKRYNHISTAEYPNGTLNYRTVLTTDTVKDYGTTWAWANYRTSHDKLGNVVYLKSCLGNYECLICAYSERPKIPAKKFIYCLPKEPKHPYCLVQSALKVFPNFSMLH
ncbi:hypothetical protein BG004_005384, partial [Podila humilis]